MIHPHFFIVASSPDKGGHADFNYSKEQLSRLKLDPKYTALQKKYGIKAPEMEAFLRTVLMHRFYKDRVDEVAANPEARLVILQGENEDTTPEVAGLGKFLSDKEGPFKGGRFQEKLIVYAKEKLKSRLQVIDSNVDPSFFAAPCCQNLGLDRLSFKGKIVVYGETMNVCPKDAAESLKLHGFKDVELRVKWCPQ